MNKVLGVLAAAIVGSGCVVDVVFEPIGGDISVMGNWTINSGPANAATCNASGIASVQLFVCDAIDGDCFSGAEIRSDCSNGTFTTAPLLQPDTYALQWAAFDATGAEIGRGPWETQTVFGGGILSTNVDFVMAMPGEVTMDGSWLINGGVADATSCNDAGIDTVRLEVTDDLGAVFRQFDIPCANGLIDSRTSTTDPTLPEGNWATQWFALDTGGAVLSQTDSPLALVTTGQTHVGLAVPDFIVVTINTLDVAFTYDVGDGTAGDCTVAGVDGVWGYVLSTAGGTTIDMQFGLTCQNGIIFDDIASDLYVLDINADATDGTKWGGLCEGLDVLGLSEYDCQLPITP